MELHRYHDEDERFRTALITKEGTKWMRVLVIDGGRLRMISRPLTDKAHMATMTTNERKSRATFRRLARLKGTSREIRRVVKEAV